MSNTNYTSAAVVWRGEEKTKLRSDFYICAEERQLPMIRLLGLGARAQGVEVEVVAHIDDERAEGGTRVASAAAATGR